MVASNTNAWYMQSQLTDVCKWILSTYESKIENCVPDNRQWPHTIVHLGLPILIRFAKSNVNIYLYPIKAYVQLIHSSKFILHWRIIAVVWQTIRENWQNNVRSAAAIERLCPVAGSVLYIYLNGVMRLCTVKCISTIHMMLICIRNSNWP